MDDETFKACEIAIRERIKTIDVIFAKNSPQSQRAGLVKAAYAIDILARRYIKKPDWPGHTVPDDVRMTWELSWYLDYVKAIAEVCKAVQRAAIEQRLTLRSQLTKTQLDAKILDSWLEMDIDITLAKTFDGFWPGLLQLRMLDRWPDMVCLPPGALDIQNLAEWVAVEQLASADEIREMLSGKDATASPTESATPLVLSPHVTKNSTKERRDALKPVIELAMQKCRNLEDTAEVWANLLALAEKGVAPLLGATEDGLQYLNQGTVAIFTLRALSKRLARMALVRSDRCR